MSDTPFGLSFGNPSKYMGQSPLGEIGKAAKTALTAYGLQKSGITDWLNSIGKKPDQQSVVQGAVPLPSSFNQYLSPVQPTSMATMPKIGSAPASSFAPNVMPATPQMQFTPPADIGIKILEGDDSWQHNGIGMPNQMFD